MSVGVVHWCQGPYGVGPGGGNSAVGDGGRSYHLESTAGCAVLGRGVG